MAAGATYEPIATTTLGSATGVIDFTSIAATYTDLKLILIGDLTAPYYTLTFNNDTATNYSATELGEFNGNTVFSSRTTSVAGFNPGATYGFSTMFHTYNFMSYAGSTYKTSLMRLDSSPVADDRTSASVFLWRSTAAINRITLTTPYYTFTAGLVATLYGIKAA